MYTAITHTKLMTVKLLVPVTNRLLASIFKPFPVVGTNLSITIGSIGATPNSGIPREKMNVLMGFHWFPINKSR